MAPNLLHADYCTGADERVTETVLRAVADAKGIDPVDLQTPLNEVVDPDALDRLFRPRHGGRRRTLGSTTFEYAGYEVSVGGDGRVTVSETRR